MIRMTLREAAQAMRGSLQGIDGEFVGVTTDSRHVAIQQLFLALRGDNFDGHDFIATAQASGACAAVVDLAGSSKAGETKLPLILVDDTRLALGRLAAVWRQKFTLPLLAITGSNGKTTTKEMIACILRLAFADKPESVLVTEGNLNNDIGLPLTLLQLNATHQAAVVEMGMNHAGEIAYLTRLAKPTIALITNVQRAHLEGLGDLQAVALEKRHIFDSLATEGIAVFSADEPWAALWRQSIKNSLTFAFNSKADVHGTSLSHGLENHLQLVSSDVELEIPLAVPGKHNASNALAAATTALAAGIAPQYIARGLANFQGVKGRLQQRRGLRGALLIDDTYNANPDSVRAAINVLAAMIGKKILVFGDMGEVGEMGGQFHDEIGGYAKSQGIDRLLTLGKASATASRNFAEGAQHCRSLDELLNILRKELTPETTVLVKGSRFMRMERVVAAIEDGSVSAQQKGVLHVT